MWWVVVATAVFYAAAVTDTPGGRRRLIHLPSLMAVGVGLALSNSVAPVPVGVICSLAIIVGAVLMSPFGRPTNA